MTLRKTSESLSGPGYAIDVSPVPWDTDIFGFPVAQIDRIEIAEGGNSIAASARVRGWLRDHNVRLASCRLPASQLRASMALEDAGFRFIEMVYAPVLVPLPRDVRHEDRVAIRTAALEDLPELEAIAGSAFSTGRFLLDWRLDGACSHRRYRTWVRNAFWDTRQRVLKATLDDTIVGFFVVQDEADFSVYWHLTAVAPAWQGRGLGKRIWATMVSLHAADGRRRIETTISAHNAPVMNIYAGLGFRFGAPQMTFHWVAS